MLTFRYDISPHPVSGPLTRPLPHGAVTALFGPASRIADDPGV